MTPSMNAADPAVKPKDTTSPEVEDMHQLRRIREVPPPPPSPDGDGTEPPTWKLPPLGRPVRPQPQPSQRLSVLRFNPGTGRASGFLPQSEADLAEERARRHERADADGRAECRALIDAKDLLWVPPPLPTLAEMRSDRCARRWPAEVAGEYICSADPGHDGGCEARTSAGVLIAALVVEPEPLTEPVKPARPSPRPRPKPEPKDGDAA